MPRSELVSIPASLAAELLQVLNAAAHAPHHAATAPVAVALAQALARHNPAVDYAFGPMGDELFSANDPTAWSLKPVDTLIDS